MARLTESTVESATIAWLEALSYAVKHDAEVDTGEAVRIWRR